jgi:hypothetical protein
MAPLLPPDLVAWQRETYRRSLHDFVSAAWPHCESRPFVDGRHLRVLCDVLQEHAASTGDLVVNVPPGTQRGIAGTLLRAAATAITATKTVEVVVSGYVSQS